MQGSCNTGLEVPWSDLNIQVTCYNNIGEVENPFVVMDRLGKKFAEQQQMLSNIR